MKNIIVMCPTVEVATEKCKEFLRLYNPGICRFHKNKLMIGLTDGVNIYFKGETEGQRALRGFHADVVQIDEFEMDFMGENKNESSDPRDE